MKYLHRLAIGLLIYGSSTLAQEPALTEILRLVDQDAAVIKAQREARSAEIDVQLVEITGAPTLDFSTRGRYPITSEIEDVRDRFSDLDAEYIDGVVTLNVPLTDFGRRDAETDASQLRSHAAAIGVDIVRQETLADLLQMATQIRRTHAQNDVFKQILKTLTQRVDEAKLRYRGGTGTLATVRTLELRRLEIETDLKESTFEAELTEREFKRRFGMAPAAYVQPVESFVESLVLSARPFEVELLDSQSQLYLEQSALRFEAVAVEKSRLPEVTGTVTGTFFNIDSRLGDAYDVVGGLNASLPLVDAGARDAQLSQIALRAEILEEELVMDREERERLWDSNQTRREEIQTRVREQTETRTQLGKELDELSLRAQTLDSRPVELALTEVDVGLAEVALIQSSYDWLDAMIEAFLIRDELFLTLIGQIAGPDATSK